MDYRFDGHDHSVPEVRGRSLLGAMLGIQRKVLGNSNL